MIGRRRIAAGIAGGALLAAVTLAHLLLTAGAASADEPTTGTITIVLDAAPNDAQDVTFTGCQGPWCGPFTLDDDTDPTRSNSTTADLEPGTYTVTQDAIPNWTLSTLTCDTGETTSLANRRATIDLTAGEDVTCTFTNTSASITIRQSSNPADAHDFTYTGCLGTGCSTFSLDDDANATLPNQTGAAGLAPGTYVITQALDPDWAVTSISCTTGESVSLANRRATITLTAGEQTTCTFTDRAPSITIVQNADPDDAQDFAYTSCLGSGCGAFALDDDSDPTNPPSITGQVLAAGTYTITQDEPAVSWPLSGLSCSTSETVSNFARKVTITLAPGEQTTCTFTNTRSTTPGTLTISEDREPDGPDDVTVHRCGDTGCTDIVLDDDARPDRSNTTSAVSLPPGYYTATADPVDGLEVAAISCTTSEPTDVDTRRVTVRLDPGEDQTCTFVHRQPQPPLTGVAQISAGTRDTCVRLTTGQARCWGDNADSAKLGDGTFTSTSTPAVVLRPDGGGPLTDVASISAGFAHSCAALSSGEARCWGYAGQGTLGNGNTSTSPTRLPAVVSNPAGTGPLTDVIDVGAGGGGSCALLGSGEVRCWGINSLGQVGDGTTNNRARPVAVSDPTGTGPLIDAAQLEVGLSTACTRLTSGEARCWGANPYGGLGDGTTVSRVRPVAVSNAGGSGPLTGIASIAGGWGHTCAVLENGQARCWGSNSNGQLGDGTTTNASRPVVVSNPDGTGPLTGVREMDAANNTTCAVLDSGEAYCWGENSSGQLGTGSTDERHRPTLVSAPIDAGAIEGVQHLSVGLNHACAIVGGAEVRCWGGNGSGALGDGTLMRRARPVSVIDPSVALRPLADVEQISTGDIHSCVLLTDGHVRCWGGDGTATPLLGNPDVRSSNVAVPVSNDAGTDALTGVEAVTVGRAHTCALMESGQARCWGANGSGQLGDGTRTNRVLPVTVLNEDGTAPLTGIVQIDAGYGHTCAVLANGQARCWGDNSDGALGDGTAVLEKDLPVVVVDPSGSQPLVDVATISSGSARTCAMLTSGQARCWGVGRLGDGSATVRTSIPVVVSNPDASGPLTDVDTIESGQFGSCAALTTGQARCWDYLTGDGTSTRRASPVAVSNPSASGPLIDVAAIRSGDSHNCALLTSGQVRCWSESNQFGELGAPPGTTSRRPIVVADPRDGGAMVNVTAIGAGRFHTCAVGTDGGVRCWGANIWGTLGDGTMTPRVEPVDVLEPISP